MPDGIDTVRATLTRLERFDRALIEQLPGTRAVQMRFQQRIFGPFYSTVARLRAQTLAPLEALVANEPAGPVGREQVLDALARYELLPRRERPKLAAFASATGFTPEAKALVHSGNTPTLVLLGGRPDGGWSGCCRTWRRAAGSSNHAASRCRSWRSSSVWSGRRQKRWCGRRAGMIRAC